jgi:probable phosphoglycerate mutase
MNERTPTRLVLVRHGESKVTVRRVIGGHRSCDGLSDLGRRQAERLATRLAETGEIPADRLVSSHYRRAIETAETVAATLQLPVEIDAGFGEHDPGPDLDGMPFAEFVDRFGIPDWNGDPHAEIFPGGETTAEFHVRVGAALSRLVGASTGQTVLVSCHGGVVDAVFRQLLRTPPTGGFELHTRNASITEFVTTPGDRWRLSRYNDAAHLAGLPDETARTTSAT